MSEKIKAACSNGHKFPVNLKKHRYRRNVYCPKCGESVDVRPKIFIFGSNPKWFKEKQRREQERREMKMARRRKKKEPLIRIPVLLPAGLSALSRLIQKQEEERKIKEAVNDNNEKG